MSSKKKKTSVGSNPTSLTYPSISRIITANFNRADINPKMSCLKLSTTSTSSTTRTNLASAINAHVDAIYANWTSSNLTWKSSPSIKNCLFKRLPWKILSLSLQIQDKWKATIWTLIQSTVKNLEFGLGRPSKNRNQKIPSSSMDRAKNLQHMVTASQAIGEPTNM